MRPAAVELSRSPPRVASVLGLGVGRAPGLRSSSRRAEGHSEAQYSQSQVQEVIEDGVAVGDQPEHHGHNEPKDADNEVDDPQGQDYTAGRREVHSAEAYIGQKAARGQVDDVLDYVDVEDAQPHPVAKYTSWATSWMRMFLAFIHPSAWKGNSRKLAPSLFGWHHWRC